jgi:hypothetical protein
MQFHHVDVDDEVFAHVQQHAEPLIDDFNTTIKRLLGLSGHIVKAHSTQSKLKSDYIPGLSLPRDVPQALRQIMEVAYLVSMKGESRTDATRMVAKHHQVAPQTVQDKYCRQLNFTAREFDRLLDEPQLNALRGNLKNKFFEHIALIDEVLTDETAV